jgi:hypothetical protein
MFSHVRDSDAVLIVMDRAGLSLSKGTMLAKERTHHHGKSVLAVDISHPDADTHVDGWLRDQRQRF